MAYTKYSLTPANNNATPPDGAPEGMLPSAVNDTMRDMMAQIRDVGDGIRNGTYTMTAPVITGGSISGVALSGNTFTNPVITGGSINNTTIGGSTAAAGTFTSLTDSGNLTFTGTGNRITGDFSNATIANRVMFQNSVTNGPSNVHTLPNGTGTTAGFLAFANSDPANTNFAQIAAVGAETRINSGITGTGTFAPMTFYTGGSERLRIDTSGNVGIGTSSPAVRFNVGGGRSAFGANSETYSIALGFTQARVNSGQVYYIGATDSTTPDLVFSNSSGTERMRIDSSGNVGIGTSSPTRTLDVNGNMRLGTANGRFIEILNASSEATYISQESSAELRINQSTSGANSKITFLTQGSERMRITSGGQVVIGTTAPAATYRLTVENSAGIYVNAGTGNFGSPLELRGTATSSILFQLNATGGGYNGITQAGDPLILGMQNQSLLVGVHDGSAIRFGDTDMRFATDSTERMRLDSAGRLVLGTTSVAGPLFQSQGGSGTAVLAQGTGTTSRSFEAGQTNASYAWHVAALQTTRTANSAFSFLICESDAVSTFDKEFILRGDGNAYADGTWNNNGADYAEYFESATGQAIPVGSTVVLENNKVRIATESDNPSDVIGVVRPKEPSKASMVVGNTAWNKWANKYLTDDFDRYIMEDHDVIEWTDENGELRSYESQQIPADVVVPADAVRKSHDENGKKYQHYKLNPEWNPNTEYINRENRDEWVIIGLVGQVKVLKGQVMGERWKKMRDVSASVEEWFIR